MNKTLLAVVLAVIIVAGAYAVYQSGDSTATPTPTPTSSLDATTETEDSGVDIAISNQEYSPNSITVAAGSTVTWTNNDSVGHTVTGDAGPETFSSPLFNAGQTFSYTFTKAGTYTYHCTAHPSMTGTVVVTE